MSVISKPSVREPALWQAVGNTPLLPLELRPGHGRILLKAEWLNPGGSVKDRAARAILRDGLCRGELPGKRLLEIVAAIDGRRYEEFPCYISARALEGFEARVKTINALLKGDKSDWAKGIKREAKRALDFARRLHLGHDISEALADNLK